MPPMTPQRSPVGQLALVVQGISQWRACVNEDGRIELPLVDRFTDRAVQLGQSTRATVTQSSVSLNVTPVYVPTSAPMQ